MRYRYSDDVKQTEEINLWEENVSKILIEKKKKKKM